MDLVLSIDTFHLSTPTSGGYEAQLAIYLSSSYLNQKYTPVEENFEGINLNHEC